MTACSASAHKTTAAHSEPSCGSRTGTPIPSPSPKIELAVAGLAQAGRLLAGDATYGVTTPWRYGVGVALIGAVPSGAKHTVRLEFGVPVNPSGPRALEFRVGYGDRTAFFGGEPPAITNAREVAR